MFDNLTNNNYIVSTVRSLAYYCDSLRSRATRQSTVDLLHWLSVSERACPVALWRASSSKIDCRARGVASQSWLSDFGFGVRMALRVALSVPSLLVAAAAAATAVVVAVAVAIVHVILIVNDDSCAAASTAAPIRRRLWLFGSLVLSLTHTQTRI